MGKTWRDERSGSGTGIVTVLPISGSGLGGLHGGLLQIPFPYLLYLVRFIFSQSGGGIREGRGNLFEGIEAQEYIGSRGLGIYWEYRLRNILGVED